MARPSRLRSYAVILLGALGFGVAGALFDQLTVTLSPEYFLLGKHVDAGRDLRASAALVGFGGGLPLGALVLGVHAWLRARGRELGLWRLLGLSALAVLPASLLAVLALWLFDPFKIRADSAGLLAPGVADRFLLVWGLHIGAYVGPIAMVASVAVRETR